MQLSADEVRRFYDGLYSHGGDEGLVYARWRALGARGKADHVLALRPARPSPDPTVSVLEVGCGDGALMAELRARRPAWSFAGVDVAAAPVALARARNPEADVREYDGGHLPYDDSVFNLGVISHVLEHVGDPASLLRETARVCDHVVVEVPLEANVSARRTSKLDVAADVGHVQRFGRKDIRAVIAAAGLRVSAELTDPLPRDVHRFFADTRAAKLRADVKWLIRRALHEASPRLAARVTTLHYAALCVR